MKWHDESTGIIYDGKDIDDILGSPSTWVLLLLSLVLFVGLMI